jgi:recombination protein RecR
MEFSSKLIENAVNEISNLPGIGKKTALRLVLHLLKQPKSFSINLSNAISEMRLKVNFCKNCHNISDTETCQICSNPKRDNSTICVVEDIRDVIAIEKTSSFNGIYHVLGGKISPLDGIGPDDLTIESLINKIKDEKIKEVIFALSTTMEGDTTNFYIYRKISDLDIITSTIARGVSVGDNLEYTDEVTLGRSISERIPFIKSISG